MNHLGIVSSGQPHPPKVKIKYKIWKIFHIYIFFDRQGLDTDTYPVIINISISRKIKENTIYKVSHKMHLKEMCHKIRLNVIPNSGYLTMMHLI